MGLTINLEFDSAAQAAPASFRTAIQNAASLLDAAITTPITVNIQIRYGENGIAATSAEAGAESGGLLGYAAARADLLAGAQAGDGNFGSLPTGSINGQSQVELARAESKAFGLIGATDTGLDGVAIFGTGISSNLLVGVALHELTHAMGRVPDSTPNIFEFTRYTSAGNRLFNDSIPAPASYFSLDGGYTKLADYGQSSDPSDFLNNSATTNDPFDEFYNSSTLQQLTSLDLNQLDVLGFNVMQYPSFDTSWSLGGVGDFNGDHKADLVYRNTATGAAEVELLNGITPMAGAPIFNNPFASGWNLVAIGDFTGNGKSDLAWQFGSGGLVEIQYMNGSSPAGGGTILNNPFTSGWSVLGVGDFTGSGTDDLVWARQSDGLVEIQLLNGATAIGGGTIANNPFSLGWNVVAIGDFQGNGKSDLVWQRASDGLVEVQFMNSNNAVGGGTITNNPFGAGWNVVGAGDFQGNGKSDLVWQNASSGLVEIQFINGATAVGGGTITNNPFSSGWTIVGVGDFNNDGKADLVYRRNSDGLTEVQLLNGGTAIGGGTLSAAGMSGTSANAQALAATQAIAAVPAGSSTVASASSLPAEDTSLQNTLAAAHHT